MNIYLLIIFLVFTFLFISIENVLAAGFSIIKRAFKNIFRNFGRKKLKKKKKKKPSLLFVKFRLIMIGASLSFIFLFVPILMIIFIQDLPSPYALSRVAPSQTTKIYDRNGVFLTDVYSAQNRTLVPLSEIPMNLQNATLAIEDKTFYKHPGFDVPSIFRAARENLLNKRIQGGSTITQQLIKSSILTPERSITRKVKELVLAFWAERIYTKKEILEMYFNQVPYGGTAWGVEAASETYFDKPVNKLTLAESAFLAGLTAAPTTYSPYGNNPGLWKKRQKEVLNRMVALKYISEKQAQVAYKEQLDFKPQEASVHAPHFVNYIKEQLVKKYGIATVERGGLQVTTTIDLKTQEMAEDIVREEVKKYNYLNLTNGAAVVTNPKNGDIIAMVGGHDFNDPNGGNVNLATSRRQPGSSIKVVTYSAALERGLTAASVLDDTPVSYPSPGSESYSPVNYDGRYRGRVSLRLALANSLNIPAVKTLNVIGVPAMVELGREMGIKSWGEPEEYGLSIALGAAEVTMLDMAMVNGTLANNGERVDINPILKITDVKGRVFEEKKPEEGEQVLDPGIAFIISSILSDNVARSLAFGSNSPLVIPGHTVAVKTGTTDDKRDNWTNGYTNNFAAVVWVGNNDNSPMSQQLASGITGAAPIWNRIMTNLLNKNREKPLTPTSDIVQKTCLGKNEYFLKGTEESVYCGTVPTQSVKYSGVQRSL